MKYTDFIKAENEKLIVYNDSQTHMLCQAQIYDKEYEKIGCNRPAVFYALHPTGIKYPVCGHHKSYFGKCCDLDYIKPAKNKNLDVLNLYRGKGLAFGQWVYGSLISDEVLTDNCGPIIKTSSGNIPVDLKTVGRYTGQKDHTNKMIFQDDKLKRRGESFESVVFWDNDKQRFYRAILDGKSNYTNIPLYPGETKRMEIVGNIHDNPENK